MSVAVPARMQTGLRYTVAVTMQNTGETTWVPNYNLGSQKPHGNQIWGLGRVAVTTAVAPGQQYTFSFPVTAPLAGAYTMQWGMVQDGGAMVWRRRQQPGHGDREPGQRHLHPNSSRTETASAAWVGYPSSCTWTATGAGGSTAHTETMTTQPGAVASTVTYIHTDGLGSPVARTNAAGGGDQPYAV